MTEPAHRLDVPAAPEALPDLGDLVRRGEWRRALAVSRVGDLPAKVQDALGAVNGMHESLRAKRYPAARRYLAEYREAVQHADSGELSVIRRTLNPDDLDAAIQALNDHQREPDAEALARGLAPALALPFTRPDALNMMAVLSLLQGEPERAREQLNEALALDPGHYRALTNVGNLYLEAGNAVLAEQTYREVLALNPEYDGGHHNLGVALRRQGKMNEAVRAIRRGQRLTMKRTKEETDAEVKEQLGRSPVFKTLRWLALAAVLLLIWLALRAGH